MWAKGTRYSKSSICWTMACLTTRVDQNEPGGWIRPQNSKMILWRCSCKCKWITESDLALNSSQRTVSSIICFDLKVIKETIMCFLLVSGSECTWWIRGWSPNTAAFISRFSSYSLLPSHVLVLLNSDCVRVQEMLADLRTSYSLLTPMLHKAQLLTSPCPAHDR